MNNQWKNNASHILQLNSLKIKHTYLICKNILNKKLHQLQFLNLHNLVNSKKLYLKKTAYRILFIYCFFTISGVKSQFNFYRNNTQCSAEKTSEKHTPNTLELNNLEARAAVLSHNANNPLEDRFQAVELKNFKGYFISVLDGHGGHELAEFANSRLFKYFDTIYKELREKNTKRPEDDVVSEALFKTFEKVEKEFYDLSIAIYRAGNGRAATVGSCVTISVISPSKIYTAQLGDSKAKLFRKNDSNDYDVIKLTTTFNSEKKSEQDILHKEFKDEKDIVVCKRPNNKVCYVKGRLQPTRVINNI